MSTLRFVFGPSGSGKSTAAYEEITRRASEHPEQNFFVIVPDQFTMQTQAQLVRMNPRGGILNIDVLSFGRLTHRILEEVGWEETPVLDDTGKSLVLQKVAASLEKELPTLGRRMHRQGYISEVKSAISEFMQYGIAPGDLDVLIEKARGRGALEAKLRDLRTLYRGFRDYLSGRFITTEERLDVLRDALSRSRLLPGSVVVFDGFTGFTPIQLRVVADLMERTEETILTFALGAGEDAFAPCGEEDLFWLTHKTAQALARIAGDRGISRGEDVFCGRERENRMIAHLERNLFRNGEMEYAGKDGAEADGGIDLTAAADPAEEARQVALQIAERIREAGLCYRDIAVVCGELEGYAPYLERELVRMEIPYYIDRTHGIRLNPASEAIAAALDLYRTNFTADAVARFLRSGLSGFAAADADELEAYFRRTGIRGRKKWDSPFTRRTKRMSGMPEEEAQAELERLNVLRERFLRVIRPLDGDADGMGTVFHHVNCLYEFLVGIKAEEGLRAYEERFHESGDLAREREYAQIYRLILELLDQIAALLGEEEISRAEFAEIVSAGFGEIRVGTIPQNVDRVVVGDMERTRLRSVRELFFLGVNDGLIPKDTGGGGILSDLDREFLGEAGTELAPTPRQQMYTQRLYLYLNMTKPVGALHLSYARRGSDGRALRPSYLISVVKAMFPRLSEHLPEADAAFLRVANPWDGMRVLAEGLRMYASEESAFVGGAGSESEWLALYAAYGEPEAEGGDPASGKSALERRAMLQAAAFRRYLDLPLAPDAVDRLYGTMLRESVSSIESYAECAYRFFLRYGISLREEDVYEVSAADRGTVIHAALEGFAEKLREDGIGWNDFTDAYAADALRELLGRITASYGAAVYYDSARSAYHIRRMERMLLRSVHLLREQVRAGEFRPAEFEKAFLREASIGDARGIRLRGVIDRVDLAERDGTTYVKILDYKSGRKTLDLQRMLEGRQIQLPLYMNQELRERPSARPAALLYYSTLDPLLPLPAGAKAPSEEELGARLRKELRAKGLVSEDETALALLDRRLAGLPGGTESEVVPVKLKKDGGFAATGSGTIAEGDLRMLLEYSEERVVRTAREIYAGKITKNPWEEGSCEYCPYRRSCGFDAAIPGYRKRWEKKRGRDEILEEMRSERRES